MSDWQTRVRRHLRDARPGPARRGGRGARRSPRGRLGRAARRRRTTTDARGVRAPRRCERADFAGPGASPDRRRAAARPEPGSGSLLSGLGGELRHTLRLLRPRPGLHRRRRRRAGPRHRGHDRRLRAGLLGAARAAALRRRRSPRHGVGAQPHPRPGPQRHQPRQLLRVVGAQHVARDRGRLRADESATCRATAAPPRSCAAWRCSRKCSACSGRARWPAGCSSKATTTRARRRPSSSARGSGDGASAARPTPSAAPW